MGSSDAKPEGGGDRGGTGSLMLKITRAIAEAKELLQVEECDVWNRPIGCCPCVDCTLLRIRLATLENDWESRWVVRMRRSLCRFVAKLRGRS